MPLRSWSPKKRDRLRSRSTAGSNGLSPPTSCAIACAPWWCSGAPAAAAWTCARTTCKGGLHRRRFNLREPSPGFTGFWCTDGHRAIVELRVAYNPFKYPWLKLLSVALATLLWLTVAGDHLVERSMRVPLEFRDLPPEL